MKHAAKIAAMKEAARHGGKETGAADALCEFAGLLCQLAEDADDQAERASQTADKNLKIADRAFWVSVIALFIAVLQFFNAPSWAAGLFVYKNTPQTKTAPSQSQTKQYVKAVPHATLAPDKATPKKQQIAQPTPASSPTPTATPTPKAAAPKP